LETLKPGVPAARQSGTNCSTQTHSTSRDFGRQDQPDQDGKGAGAVPGLTPLTRTVSCPYMKAITYTAAREGLASTMDEVCRDRAPVIITRKRDQAVVMVSLEDYESLEETAYLLRSPANARRLLAAIESLGRGKGKERRLKPAA